MPPKKKKTSKAPDKGTVWNISLPARVSTRVSHGGVIYAGGESPHASSPQINITSSNKACFSGY